MDLSLGGTTMLVGIDFSEHCERALLRAVALAESSGAQIELVHVFEWEHGQPALPTLSAAPLRTPSHPLWAAVVAQAQTTLSRLGQFCSSFVGDRATARIRVVIGEPGAALLDAASRASAPLIVLGVRGRRTQSHGRLGTTVERVCAGSQVPVLLVPGAVAEWMPDSQLLIRSSRYSVVCSCSRCGTVQVAHRDGEQCRSCGTAPDIWVSTSEPSLLL